MANNIFSVATFQQTLCTPMADETPKATPQPLTPFSTVVPALFLRLLFRHHLRRRFLHPQIPSSFLIPYMAIRLNEADADSRPSKLSRLGSVMTNGAAVVGLIGGAICVFSAIWALYGRMDGEFVNITDRWQFLVSYLGSERLAYAFIWDICLYAVFQPWLIGENLQNVEKSKVGVVSYLRFIPVVGLVAYLLFLNLEEDQ
ncbi:hypothetical protein Gotur_020817 [Gossypium turneri]